MQRFYILATCMMFWIYRFTETMAAPSPDALQSTGQLVMFGWGFYLFVRRIKP